MKVIEWALPATAWDFTGLKSPSTTRARPDAAAATRLAVQVLGIFGRHRRMVQTAEPGCEPTCAICLAPHLPKAVSAIRAGDPVTFVLPAFPGKSPNPAKVLGHLPDMAEEQALRFLDSLCRQVRRLHAPGVRIVLCSDGRVFSDLVGMDERHITAYQEAIDRMIRELSLDCLSTFSLDDLYEDKRFDRMRSRLMDQYGQPLDVLKDKVKRGGKGSDDPVESEAHRMYCGITRFLFEDALHPGQRRSRTAIQKDARVRAYEVIRRSNAWSGLVAERFPDAVRLSIHPQTCGARKLGIQLLSASSWLTPWHGVAVDTGRGFELKKRSEAERLGARLVRNADGRASHYELRGTC